MRKFLRFLMLVLMATWGVESYAEVIYLKPSDVGGGKNYYQSSNGDITLSMTSGKKPGGDTQNNWEKKKYDGATGEVIALPVGADFTVSCLTGKIDYILFSFNNGSWSNKLLNIDHSEHWSSISVNGNPESSDTKGSYYHGKSFGGDDRCAWWGGYSDDGVSSVTFWDKRTDGGNKYFDQTKNKYQTQGWLWMYVFYHKDNSSNSALTITASNTFTGDNTTVYATSKWTSSINNWSASCPMYYTIDGSTPTTSSSKYSSSGIPVNCTRKIQILNQAEFLLADFDGSKVGGKSSDCNNHGKDTDGYFEGLPATYKPQSEVHPVTVTQVWPVTVKNGYATFAHSNKMRVPTGYTAQAYKAGKTNANGITSIVPCGTAFKGGDIIPANTAVIVSGSNASNVTFENPLNNKYSNSNTDAQETTADNTAKAKVSDNCLYGYYNSSTKVTNNSSYYYYYLMKESSASNSRYGFFWANNDGSAVTNSNWVKNLVHKAYFMYPKKNAAKGFVFQLPDEQETTGITGVSNGHEGRGLDPSAPMYNAAGQRVGASYKGIVIQNGRKFVKR